jgi:hypothetical protein
MSTTTLYKVYKRSTIGLEEFDNGNLSARPLWDYLAKTYLGWGDDWQHTKSPEDDKALWRLARDRRVPRPLRLCHAMTFDHAVIPPHGFREASDVCFEVGTTLLRNSHWAGIGTAIGRVVHAEPDPLLCGIALNCTSVNDIWWNRKNLKATYDATQLIVEPL